MLKENAVRIGKRIARQLKAHYERAFCGRDETAMTMDLADPTAVLLATAEAFERAGIRIAAYGGLVLAAYGTPRETKDADLAVRLVTPEDFVILKILSTRERDLEDASTVLGELCGRIDSKFLEQEVAELAREMAEHDVAGRYQQLRGLVSNRT
ncbi:MAG TPA: hypothetical protein VFG23_11115 [Polyangia bacterium]|nr:hypothetical protein [Polyangia bacterium]